MRYVLVFIMILIPVVTGCGSTIPMGAEEMKMEVSASEIRDGQIVKGMELMCLADSREEAEQIAESYGIKLVDFSYGVAVFHTEDDPNEVIKKGKKMKLKELSINRMNKLF